VCSEQQERGDEIGEKSWGWGWLFIAAGRKGKERWERNPLSRAGCCRCRNGFVPCGVERSRAGGGTERNKKPPAVEVERRSGTLERCRAEGVNVSAVCFAWLGAGGSLLGVR